MQPVAAEGPSLQHLTAPYHVACGKDGTHPQAGPELSRGFWLLTLHQPDAQGTKRRPLVGLSSGGFPGGR